MPELPEVETIRRGLEGLIVGATITEVEVRLPKMVRGEVDRLIDATILTVRRRGKGLLIDLSNEYTLAVHVKMTGQLIYKERQRRKGMQGKVKNLHPKLSAPFDLPSKHTHVIFKLKKQKSKGKSVEAFLFYNDIRQFGWLHVLPTKEIESLPFFMSLGPEPLKNLDEMIFAVILDRSKAPIKSVLMDQSRVSGVGNIYANDALFHAGIHPLRPANELTEEERNRLFQAVEFVLREGIKAGGASENTFLNALGEKGFYQERFLVYNRTGKPCLHCKTPIERIVVGGRGTFFCPSCQLL